MARRIFRWLHRRKMSRSHLRGGRLHRWFGDHLFNPHLWMLEREGVSRAMFWGLLICLSPFFGLHFILGIAVAMYFRANIPVTIIVQVLTNPATAVLYYPAAYALGARLLGHSVVHRSRLMEVLKGGSFQDWMNLLQQIWVPLFLGCFLCGITAAVTAWFLVNWCWPKAKKTTPPSPVDKGPIRTPTG
ncbi:MAG: DUF2062 domain-containing protein [Candidatus Methylacidiphilales bacterium]|nr:DUF2062 domain-containing protein [Candidatus Methylacidiphilales bacterium]